MKDLIICKELDAFIKKNNIGELEIKQAEIHIKYNGYMNKEKESAKKIVYFGFLLGVFLTFYFSTNYKDLISIRIAIGSGVAFLTSQLIDVNIFDKLREKKWFVAPLTSSLIASTIDTFLFFSISFYGTGVRWITLSVGDLCIKILFALLMLIPFRILLFYIKNNSLSKKKINVL